MSFVINPMSAVRRIGKQARFVKTTNSTTYANRFQISLAGTTFALSGSGNAG
jgi:hypothetical protein